MTAWPRNPLIYEIHTWIWLRELSEKHQRSVRLATVPSEEWDAIAEWRMDAVWLMGVWERSPKAIEIFNASDGVLQDFGRALPDFCPQDNVGSPFSVRRYAVDPHLGGPEGLAAARQALAARGMKLLLDFVPNHVAPDHPWVTQHPDYFVRGRAEDAEREPEAYLAIDGHVFARGRDPHFPAWRDVLQLNAFEPALRQAAVETLCEIADACDGVRCDMAILLLNEVFKNTWGRRAGHRPATEYWIDVNSAVKRAHPEFLLIAEAYWDREWELQQQGFDYCYDKRLYDRLAHDSAESVHRHLCADLNYQRKLVRFIENHDEPRALTAFSPAKARAAAVTMATLPGARLFHEGQLDGRKVRTPCSLGRRPDEPADAEWQQFYRALVRVSSSPGLREGSWALCERTGWPDNETFRNIVAWCWRGEDEYLLTVVNLSGSPAQARVLLPWSELRDATWHMTDRFTGAEYERSGDEMCSYGLYVDLPGWGFHVLVNWWGLR